ncbi:transcriptional regulator, partial [Coprococcus eutactus]|nr:transcriptional regulator [Coprococcus eutactus]
MLTNYLYDMGHRDIAYVGTIGSTNSITDRYMGYIKSLLEHDIPIREDWVIPDIDVKTGQFDEENC